MSRFTDGSSDDERFPIPTLVVRGAVMVGDVRMVRAWLKGGGDVNDPEWQLLKCAASHRQPAVVDLLLRHGADAKSDGERHSTVLDAALEPVKGVTEGNTAEVVRLLLEAGADANGSEDRDLSDLPLVQFCNGTSNISRRVGLTNAERRTIVALLLAHGAAIFRDRGSVVAAVGPEEQELILDCLPTDLTSVRDVDGATLLFHCEHPREARLLLKRGTDIEARNSRGETALFVMAKRGNRSMLECLLKAGANQDAANADGLRPLDALRDAYAFAGYDKLACFAQLLDYRAESTRPGLLEEVCVLAVQCMSDGTIADSRGGRERRLDIIERQSKSYPIMVALQPRRGFWRFLLESPAFVEAVTSFLSHADFRVSSTTVASEFRYQEEWRAAKVKAALHPQSAKRDARLELFKDDAWERRKHLVCCYFETRRRRREASNEKAAVPVSASEPKEEAR